MSEPRLENIEDYNTLKGEKKRVVWAVVLAGLIMGVVYGIISSLYDKSSDRIETQENIKHIPLK